MLQKNEKYPIEVSAEKLFNRVGVGFQRLIAFLTTIPEDKNKRMFWFWDVLAITFNVFAIASVVVALILRSR